MGKETSGLIVEGARDRTSSLRKRQIVLVRMYKHLNSYNAGRLYSYSMYKLKCPQERKIRVGVRGRKVPMRTGGYK